MDSTTRLKQFIDATGASSEVAKEFLTNVNGDVASAVRSYRFLQHSVVPPRGPQKNVEPPPATNRTTVAITHSQAVPTNRQLPQPPVSVAGTHVMNNSPAVRVSLPAAAARHHAPPYLPAGQGHNIITPVGVAPVREVNRMDPTQAKHHTTTISVGSAGTVATATRTSTGSEGTHRLGGTAAVTGGLRPQGPEVVAGNGATDKVQAPSSPGTCNRKLLRGLSKTSDNVELVNKARDIVLQDINEGSEDTAHFVDTPEYTFILPDLTQYPEDFRAFLHKDLIETSTLVSLEQAGRLNWWADMEVCQRLLPLATTGDGNCLLHAASLAMWGFHDRMLTLRTALYNTTNHGESKGALWRRWRWHQTQVNKQSGLILSEREWQTEWSNLLKLASTKPRTNPGSRASCCASPATNGLMERTTTEKPACQAEAELFYESLEEFHVFVLAHVLRRPIIVVADIVLKNCSGEALAPIPFGGIYLPLECDPADCHRSPLLLTYDAAHFSALVPMEEDGGKDGAPPRRPKPAAAIPLVNPEFKLLPIHFLADPGSQFVWGHDEKDPQKLKNLTTCAEDELELLRKYIDMMRMPVLSKGSNGDGTESGYYGDGRRRSNSWSGPKPPLQRTTSLESNDSGLSSSSSGGKEKDGGANRSSTLTRIDDDKGRTKYKDKDKKRSSRQMQSVVKAFGSLGKTMSKNLKKNFGGIGKAVKNMEAEEKVKRKPSVGSATQSTKIATPTSEMLQDRDHIICARLLHKRLEYQDKMIDNYLQSAEERFLQDRELRKQQDEEMRRKAELRRQQEEAANQPAPCINPGCEGLGTISTSYLCTQCFERQKQEALDLERGGDGGPASIVVGTMQNEPHAQGAIVQNANVVSLPPVQRGAHFQRQDTLVNPGKSKFYTYSNEDHSLANVQHDADGQNLQLNNTRVSAVAKYNKTTVDLARSSFYDAPLATAEAVQPASYNRAAPGTAVIINNLHDEDPQFFAKDVERTVTGLPPKPPQYPGRANPNECGSRGLTVGQLMRQPHIVKVRLPPEENLHTGYDNIDREMEMMLREQEAAKDLPYIDQVDGSNPHVVARAQGGLPPPSQQNARIHSMPYPNQEPCVTKGCQFFGCQETDSLCSACFRQRRRTIAHIAGK